MMWLHFLQRILKTFPRTFSSAMEYLVAQLSQTIFISEFPLESRWSPAVGWTAEYTGSRSIGQVGGGFLGSHPPGQEGEAGRGGEQDGGGDQRGRAKHYRNGFLRTMVSARPGPTEISDAATPTRSSM